MNTLIRPVPSSEEEEEAGPQAHGTRLSWAGWGWLRVLCPVLCPQGHPCALVYGHERRHYCRDCDRQH